MALVSEGARAPQIHALRMQPARARHRVVAYDRAPLDGSWEFVGLPPESADTPAVLDTVAHGIGASFASVVGAMTIGAALETLGRLDLASPPDLDGQDWWIRYAFAGPNARTDDPSRRETLVFEGLASIVDVWLNGVWLGRTDNMFVSWEADVTALLRERNVLVLCARAMRTRLAPRRPRARWRARLVGSQEWRWHRTTQLGRMPGFGPQTPPVGVWRPIVLERRTGVTVHALRVAASHVDGQGTLAVDALLDLDHAPSAAFVLCGSMRVEMVLEYSFAGWRLTGELRSAELRQWWPHTHGEPVVYECALHIEGGGGPVHVELGAIGFRSLSIETTQDQFAVTVNGERPFLRGTCWVPRDWLRPELDAGQLAREMTLLRDAGINCVRVSGCFLYPSAAFVAACDRVGILLWQDLMFSVLDYPSDDAAFIASCTAEVEQQLAVLQSAPSIMAVCGSAEVDQQSVMMGLGLSDAQHPLFHETLAHAAQRALPDVLYWPSTPSGGVVPFRTDVGTSHYFGVGAYRRPLDDARRSAVRFTTECLAFAHLPEPESPSALVLDDTDATARNRWKARVPRDGGNDWDFEVIRDHYVERLFAVDAARLRADAPDRYLALGRAASAIVVERTMQEFRRAGSPCQGALTWLWADPWCGAGWGCIDSAGLAKSPWFAMRRALKPVAIALTNESVNGVDVHLWNDGNCAVEGTLHVRLLHDGHAVVHSGAIPVRVEAHGSITLPAESVLGRFVDVANVYRFGACAHDTVHAVWLDAESPRSAAHSARSLFLGAAIIDEATLLVHGDVRAMTRTGLAARVAHEDEDGSLILSVTTSVLAQLVRIGSAAYAPEDSYFTLCPGVERRVRLVRLPDATSAPICVEAVNDHTAVQLNVVPSVPLPTGGVPLMLPNARRAGTTSVPAVC